VANKRAAPLQWVEKTLRNEGVEYAYRYAVDGRTLRVTSALGDKTANLNPGAAPEGRAYLVMLEIIRGAVAKPTPG
jgi:hypothetical protein